MNEIRVQKTLGEIGPRIELFQIPTLYSSNITLAFKA